MKRHRVKKKPERSVHIRTHTYTVHYSALVVALCGEQHGRKTCATSGKDKIAKNVIQKVWYFSRSGTCLFAGCSILLKLVNSKSGTCIFTEAQFCPILPALALLRLR